LLFPVVLIAVVPHLGLSNCPQTDAIRTRVDAYSWTVIGIDLALVVAVTASLVRWSSGRRRRWAWLVGGLALMVLLGVFGLIVAGFAAINFCSFFDI
jgi:hypothetical protein